MSRLTPPSRLHTRLLGATALNWLALGWLALAAHPALAAPLNGANTNIGQVANVQQGGTVAGQATLTSTTSGGGTAYVVNTNATRTLIDWSSFNLQSPDSLNFSQLSRNSIVLNRVTSGTAQINGVLTSTVGGAYGGNVWFTAPGGVLVGAGAVVNVGGLLATTSPLSGADSAFLASADTDTFSFGSAASGSSVSLSSGAHLTAHGGGLILSGPSVSTASGAFAAADSGGGKVVYGAASAMEVRFAPTANSDLDMVSYIVDTPSSSATPLQIAGQSAAGGIYFAGASSLVNSVISVTGRQVATQAASVGGVIVLSAGGLTTGGGQLTPTAGAPAANTSSTQLGQMSADSGITLSVNGDLSLTGAVSTGQLTLHAPGAVSQTAPLTVTTLSGDAGSASLTQTANRVAHLSGFSLTSGDFRLVTTGGTIIDGPLSGSGQIALNAQTGDLTVTSALDGGFGLSLSGANVRLNAALGATAPLSSLSITGTSYLSGGRIATSGAQSYVGPQIFGADTLLKSASGGISLQGAGNSDGVAARKLFIDAGASTVTLGGIFGHEASLDAIAIKAGSITGVIAGYFSNLAVAVSTPTVGVTVNEHIPLTIGTVTVGGQSLSGISTSNGSMVMTGLAGFNFASNVSLGIGFLNLNAQGDILQTAGAIQAKRLTAYAGGGINLSGANQLLTLSDLTASSGIQINDALTTGVSTLAGSTQSAGSGMFSLTSAGPLTLNGSIISHDGGASIATLSGDLTLNGTLDAAGQSLNLRSSGLIQYLSGAVTAQTLSLASSGPINLTTGLSIAQLGDVTASGLNLVNPGPLAVTGTLNLTGAMTLTTTSGGLSFSGQVLAGGQSVNLISAGDITQSVGGLTASSLTGAASGGFSLNGANQISQLNTLTAGTGLSLNNMVGGGMTVRSGATLSSGAGALSLTNTGDIILAGTLNAVGQTLSLQSGGAIRQTSGQINAADLRLSASGDIAMSGANSFSQLSQLMSGGVATLSDAASGGLTVTSGATIGTGGLILTSQGDLILNGAVQSGGDISLTSLAGRLALNSALSASGRRISLAALGDIAQLSSASLAADTLTAQSSGQIALIGVNSLRRLDTLQAANGLSLNVSAPGGLSTLSGSSLSSGSGALALTTSGALTLNGDLNASGQSLALTVGGGVQQAGGVISAQQFNLSAAGAASLTGANRIVQLGASSAAGFALANARSLTVGGDLISTGPISLTTTQGDLILAASLLAPGRSASLTSAGDLTQTGGVLSLDSLSASAVGTISLGKANQINTLRSLTAGGGLVVNNALGSPLTLLLGATAQSGAGGVQISNTGDLLINGQISSPGNVSLTSSAGKLTLSGAVLAPTATVSLTASGAVAETAGATLTADTLTIQSGGAINLQANTYANRLGGLIAANGLTLIDLTATGVSTLSGTMQDAGAGAFSLTTFGPLTLNGAVRSRSGPASLTTRSGDLILNGGVDASGQTLTLTASGALRQTGGTVAANLLTGSASGDFLLANANQINTLGSLTAGGGLSVTSAASVLSSALGAVQKATGGDVTLIGSGALNLYSDVLSSGSTTLRAQGGALTLHGRVKAQGSVTLAASGALTLEQTSVTTDQNASLTAGGGDLSLIAMANDTPSLTVKGMTSLLAPNGAIIIGEPSFIDTLNAARKLIPITEFNIAKGIPLTAPTAIPGRIFLSTGELNISTGIAVLQQNTYSIPGEAAGIAVLNPNHVTAPITVSSANGRPPGVIDLFVTTVSQTGQTLQGTAVAASGTLVLSTPRNKNYRANGCVIAQAGACAVLTDNISAVPPAQLTFDLLLTPAANLFSPDPTLIGTGNDEIWRKRH